VSSSLKAPFIIVENAPAARNAIATAAQFPLPWVTDLTAMLPQPHTLHAAVIRVAFRRVLQPDRPCLLVLPDMRTVPAPVRRGVQRLAYAMATAGAGPTGLGLGAVFGPLRDATEPYDGFVDLKPGLRGKKAGRYPSSGTPPTNDVTDPVDGLLAGLGAVGAGWVRPAGAGPGLGAWRPGAVALLVGDRPGPGWRGARLPNWPFISALRTGCSGWLAQHLEDASVGEHQLYWINAMGPGPAAEETDPAFLDELRPRVVVALGRNAAAWCRTHCGAFEQVHHPSHWQRWHAGQRYMLGRLLSKALR
jgi:hypothetical protein